MELLCLIAILFMAHTLYKYLEERKKEFSERLNRIEKALNIEEEKKED
jgi:hypothetical protein